jgi:tRNA threonylcarbamoyl adenosine modification protein (Sua5/YciO/YrdC/YwlC family)
VRKLKTEVAVIDPQEPEAEVLRSAAGVLEQGGLVVLPTDTVYGLVCDPRSPAAVDQIYRVKGRRRAMPLALLLHDMAQVSAYVEEIPEAAVRAMQAFWPGALTVVLRARADAAAAVRAKRDTLGFRLPAHVVPRLVAGTVGGALASTSANQSERPAATTASQALEYLDGLVHLIVDGGPATPGQESTVVSFSGDGPRILREGALSPQRLREVLGEVKAK